MITCKICGKHLLALSFRHLAGHDITAQEYKREFRVKFITARIVRKKLSRAHQGKQHALGSKRTPEQLLNQAAVGKRRWKDPKFRKAALRGMVAGWTPEVRKRVSKINRENLARPEVKEKRSRVFKELWKTASFRKKIIETRLGKRPPSYRRKYFEIMRTESDPVERKKRLNSLLWKTWNENQRHKLIK